MASPHYSTLTRFSRDDPCPVCSGNPGLPRGIGERCAGFGLGGDAYCSRPEFAGHLPIEISTEPLTYRHRLSGECGCGVEHAGPYHASSPRVGASRVRPESLPLETRDAIFSAVLKRLDLRKEAVADLYRRGLTDDDIELVGYRSIPAPEHKARFLAELVDQFGETVLRKCPGFTNEQGRTDFWTAGRYSSGQRDGYIVPYRSELLQITGLQVRWSDGIYRTLRNSRSADIYHVAGLVDHGCQLYITEGGLKAQVAHRLGGITVVGLPGQGLATEHLKVLQRLEPACVIEALDRENNQNTDKARKRWHGALNDAGLVTFQAIWEGSDVGGPKGLDDLFASGGRPRLREVSSVPAATGEKRQVRFTSRRGETESGVSLAEAQRLTRDAIEAFISDMGRRR